MPLDSPLPPLPPSCPQCLVAYGSGDARPLREQCGHTRCYRCTFASATCPLCTALLERTRHEGPGLPPDARSASLRSTSMSPCRFRSSSFRLSSRGSSPAGALQQQPRAAPYYHHQIHGVRASARPGRRRSRRVSVPLPLPRREELGLRGAPLGGLYGISPDHPVLPVLPSSKAAEEDLYARFQLLLCPSAAAADNKTNSSGGSKASSGPNVASSNTSPFSTLTGSSEVEPRLRRSPEESIYEERYGDRVYGDRVYGDRVYGDRVYGDRFYCPSLYTSPRMGAAVLTKPPLSLSRMVTPPSRCVSSQANDSLAPSLDAEFIGRSWLFEELFNYVSSQASQKKGALIVGAVGTGKTASIIRILDHVQSYQGSSGSEIYCEPVSSDQTALHALAGRVVAYHFCLAGDASTNLVPDFVHSMANQLYQSPRLAAYKELLQADMSLRQSVSLASCIADPSHALQKGIFQPLQRLRRRGKLPNDAFVMLIDGLVMPEKSGSQSTIRSLADFLWKEISNAPAILKFIVTMRPPFEGDLESVPLHPISLDLKVQHSPSDPAYEDLINYVSFRCEHSHRVSENISVTPDALESGSVLDRFTHHVVALSKGSMLFLKLILNLIENGLLVLKSGSFKILPQSLAEIFLLMFNFKFPTTASYEKHQSIFNVVLAARSPLTLHEIYQSINSGYLCQFYSYAQFLNLFKPFKDLLRKRHDNTYVFFHPALREWLTSRSRGDSKKFLIDVNVGHCHIALKLTRVDWPLSDEATLELAHHIVCSQTFSQDNKGIMTREEYQALWITQSSANPSGALIHPRNLFYPDLQVSRLLLLAGASANQVTNVKKESSVLGVASALGFHEFVCLLLEFQANPNRPNNDGNTPLIQAAAAGHLDIVKTLIENKANVSARNCLEETALVKAASFGHSEIVSSLLRCDWPRASLRNQTLQALVAAARNGHAQTIDQLIQSCQELVNEIDHRSGETALTAACKSGQVDSIKCLLQWRVSVLKKGRKGEPPLCCAAQNGHYEACKLLLDNAVPIDQANEDGRTSLIISTVEGHFGLMELFTMNDAKLDVTDKEGLTALSWACMLGKKHAVQYLLDHGADVNHADHEGRTPLDLAAHEGSVAVVRVLMEHGALVEHVDLSGMRPIDRAVSAGNADVVQCFLQKGAKLGPTTWSLAASQHKIILLLLMKLKSDGLALLRKNRFKEAAHRFSYALKKIPTCVDEDEFRDTLATLRLHLTLNLSRTKRKMNELTEAIQLANEALQLSRDSYESYFARAQAKRKGGKLEDALEDINQALSLIPEICVSSNIHRCLTDVRDEIVAELKSSGKEVDQTQLKQAPVKLKQNSQPVTAVPETELVMTSSILSESGYSSNF
ncbi:protein TANC2 isoform X2 [Hyalella azteca]|uniref:Protein TANC2 isoform X2 n=1 Tax=Hyalella azteca TaxID=294128 RepID=A0A8B7NED3_HYAAZ|nr:protein TANC2 isoform X2 [Hyalella azteca]